MNKVLEKQLLTIIRVIKKMQIKLDNATSYDKEIKELQNLIDKIGSNTDASLNDVLKTVEQNKDKVDKDYLEDIVNTLKQELKGIENKIPPSVDVESKINEVIKDYATKNELSEILKEVKTEKVVEKITTKTPDIKAGRVKTVEAGNDASVEVRKDKDTYYLDFLIPRGVSGRGQPGKDGTIGQDGEPGVGVPTGGTTNQILVKKTDSDYDTEWKDPSASSQIQADYTQTDNTQVDFIKNKPSIPTKTSDLTNDNGFISEEIDPIFNAWDKDYNDLTNKPTIPSDVNDLTDITNKYVLSSKLQTAITDDDTKVPTSGAIVDYVTGLGGGDMLKATYDPSNVNSDAFSMDNMVETTTKKVFTSTERTKLSGIEENANDYTLETHGSDKHSVAYLTTHQDISNLVETTDARLTDARTPLSHGDDKHSETYAKVADLFSGDYADLTGKPTLFSGVYSDLTGKPTIPSALSELTQSASYRTATDTEKSTWNAKQNALTADTDYLTPTTAGTTYEPKKGTDDNYVTDVEKVVIGNTSGVNTGDQDLSGKQDVLVSATNIKTINSTSLLGSGNINTPNTTYSEITTAEIDAGTATTLRTFTGRRAKYMLDKKQDVLVSGTNIKTINSTSLLGSGNIDIESGTTDHTALSNIGTNTHAQIDTHIASTSNPHSVDLSDLGVTATETELNYISGVTSAVQTQINSKAANDGWTLAGGTLTYASADSPTFVANTSVDLTGLIGLGDRIKLTQTTTKYFIVTAITSTTITLYGGTDYTLVSATISNVYYSHSKNPFGFPLNPDKWSVTVTNTSDQSQVTSGTTIYNLGGISITMPIGVFTPSIKALIQIGNSVHAAGQKYLTMSLSTANNTIIANNSASIAGGDIKFVRNTVCLQLETLTLTSKTVFYLNFRDDGGAGNTIYSLNASSTLVIKAVCAYL